MEHPHEDEEHVKWDQPDKGTWMKKTNEFGSVGGPQNKRSRIRGRSERAMAFVGEITVDKLRDRPKTVKV